MEPSDFEQAYQQRTLPWDIGRPQPAVVDMVEQRYFRGRVLDCGCGTGENALLLAERGYAVVGIDTSPTAIASARAKARERGLTAEFHVADAFALAQLGQTFDTVLDCGLMHNFPADARRSYSQSLAAVTALDGRVLLLCYSEASVGQRGPAHRLSQADICAAFQDRWQSLRRPACGRLLKPASAEGAAAQLKEASRGQSATNDQSGVRALQLDALGRLRPGTGAQSGHQRRARARHRRGPA